jgi:hypothetical protein
MENDANQERDDVYKSLVNNVKDYADLQLQLLKLNIVEKTSQILSLLIVIIAGTILLMAAFVYFSMMFVLWMKTLTGSLTYGFLIIAGFFLLLFILFVLLRKKMIINPIIKKMSSILFSESGETEVDDEE